MVVKAAGESYCTWGTAAYLYKGFSGQLGNYSALTALEAQNLLDASLSGSLLHASSTDLWIGAARHLGITTQAPVSEARDYEVGRW
jgi:hypothetical protein